MLVLPSSQTKPTAQASPMCWLANLWQNTIKAKSGSSPLDECSHPFWLLSSRLENASPMLTGNSGCALLSFPAGQVAQAKP